jgi:hypothetical protein
MINIFFDGLDKALSTHEHPVRTATLKWWKLRWGRWRSRGNHLDAWSRLCYCKAWCTSWWKLEPNGSICATRRDGAPKSYCCMKLYTNTWLEPVRSPWLLETIQREQWWWKPAGFMFDLLFTHATQTKGLISNIIKVTNKLKIYEWKAKTLSIPILVPSIFEGVRCLWGMKYTTRHQRIEWRTQR